MKKKWSVPKTCESCANWRPTFPFSSPTELCGEEGWCVITGEYSESYAFCERLAPLERNGKPARMLPSRKSGAMERKLFLLEALPTISFSRRAYSTS
uniref:Uncharacterized protein n=1 Tax=Candidatus Kentrum sp. LFY TaxID=2126342 RepID=A0A450WXJ5_9GAMM|nr:MAG: hypothetical protein BECKLFY1418C_GA0070996_11029 [Candidatus Kentron sp. LFY]